MSLSSPHAGVQTRLRTCGPPAPQQCGQALSDQSPGSRRVLGRDIYLPAVESEEGAQMSDCEWWEHGDSWGDVGDVGAQVAENPGDLYYVDRCAPDHLARAWDLTPDEQRWAALPYLGWGGGTA